jgi:hypothetical protein
MNYFDGVLARANEIKVIQVSKLKGTKEVIKAKELQLLNGLDKIDYRKSKGGRHDK